MKATSRRQIAISVLVFVLTLIAVLLAFLRVAPNSELVGYIPNVFNLAYYVPLILWVAIFALVALFLSIAFSNVTRLSGRLAYVSMFVLMLAILLVFYGFPNITEKNPRFVDSWVHGRTAKEIFDKGNLDLDEFAYQAYPSSFIFLSTLAIMSGIGLTELLTVIPLVFIALFFSFLTFLGRNLLKKPKLAIIFALIYGLSSFQLAFHFSPEIFGWLLFLLLLALMAKRINSNSGAVLSSRSMFVVLALLLIGITTSHPVTQFLTLLVMLSVTLLAKMIWRSKFTQHELVGLALLTIIMFSMWALSFGYLYFSSIVSSFVSAFRTVLSNLSYSIAAHPFQVYYPPGIAILDSYRQVLYVTVMLSSMVGAYFLWKHQRDTFSFVLTLLAVSLISAPLTLFGILPLERTIRLAFIPASLFLAYLITIERHARLAKVGASVLLFLLLTFPLNFASFYWNEISRNATLDWEVSSAKFIGFNSNGILLGEFKETAIQTYYGNFSLVYNDYYLVGNRPDIFNYTFIEEGRMNVIYITQLSVLRASWSGMNLSMELFLNSSFLDCVHSNGYSIVLVRNHLGP